MSVAFADAASRPGTSGIELRGLPRRLKQIALGLAALFVIGVVIEAAHVLQVSAGVHPALGVLAGLALAGAAAWISLPLVRALRVPRVVRPPEVPADASFEPRHLAELARYLDGYVANCARNPALSERRAAVGELRRELAALRPDWERVDSARVAVARQELNEWVEGRLSPLLEPLDERAERLIYQEALGVGLGTAISPNGTLDAFVVLWRSVQLTGKLAQLYYGRPGPLGTIRILADVALATAAASCVQSVGDSLGGLVARSLGGVAGVVAGPLTQGITNALVMVRLGYLVQERCRSFRRWDGGAQRSALASAIQATQKVAFGLVTEILRQAGSGLGAVAGAAAKGVSQAAGGLATAAGAAFDLAREVGQKIANGLRSFGSGSAEPRPGGDSTP